MKSHLFFKHLNLCFWRRKVSVEIEATLADGYTLSTPRGLFDLAASFIIPGFCIVRMDS